MNKIIRVGEKVPGYNYPVVNEREVRATAGLMLLVGIVTLFLIQTYKIYEVIYFTVGLFLIEFFLKTVIGPHASPFSVISRLIIKKQEPDYVGAIQKKFAWALGLVMATFMFIITFGFQMKGVLPLSICFACLTLMWLEAAFGICIGCKIYWYLVKKKILTEPKYRPKCSGNSCSL
ncbi:DUF4395 domain-containing protein [Candidatus Woesearchaeota archaeon]|nr:DUF4395 domain-containing protein [Candidatus Woesearchaeota archaeon]